MPREQLDQTPKPAYVPEITLQEAKSLDLSSLAAQSANRERLFWRDESTSITWCTLENCKFHSRYPAFVVRHFLKVHRDIIRGQVFLCDLCDYRTGHKGNATKHEIVHVECAERPIACPYSCGRAWFVKPEGCNQHQAEHCGRRATRPLDLYGRNWDSSRKVFVPAVPSESTRVPLRVGDGQTHTAARRPYEPEPTGFGSSSIPTESHIRGSQDQVPYDLRHVSHSHLSHDQFVGPENDYGLDLIPLQQFTHQDFSNRQLPFDRSSTGPGRPTSSRQFQAEYRDHNDRVSVLRQPQVANDGQQSVDRRFPLPLVPTHYASAYRPLPQTAHYAGPSDDSVRSEVPGTTLQSRYGPVPGTSFGQPQTSPLHHDPQQYPPSQSSRHRYPPSQIHPTHLERRPSHTSSFHSAEYERSDDYDVPSQWRRD